jgi:hypothetical protein
MPRGGDDTHKNEEWRAEHTTRYALAIAAHGLCTCHAAGATIGMLYALALASRSVQHGGHVRHRPEIARSVPAPFHRAPRPRARRTVRGAPAFPQ